jgi:hypothetical protein
MEERIRREAKTMMSHKKNGWRQLAIIAISPTVDNSKYHNKQQTASETHE